MNCRSVLSFHVWTRCGLRPNARQIRDTADCPSMPCTPHVPGASMWVSSAVTARLAPPMRRVVRHFVPACAGPGWSR